MSICDSLLSRGFPLALISQNSNYFFVFMFVFQTNKNLDMSINASNNFNINITWSIGSTGKVFHVIFQNKIQKKSQKT